jgi:hypothetical protein
LIFGDILVLGENLSGTDTVLILGRLKQDGSSRERIEQDGVGVANITKEKSPQEWGGGSGCRKYNGPEC